MRSASHVLVLATPCLFAGFPTMPVHLVLLAVEGIRHRWQGQVRSIDQHWYSVSGRMEILRMWTLLVLATTCIVGAAEVLLLQWPCFPIMWPTSSTVVQGLFSNRFGCF